MTGLIIAIKHRFPSLWRIVEWANGKAMRLRYPGLAAIAAREIAAASAAAGKFSFSPVSADDLPGLSRFLTSLPEESLMFFRPHDFDPATMSRLHRSGSFVMIAARNASGELVGYNFLRCFADGRCFHGLVVGPGARGLGIGTAMWNLGAAIASSAGMKMFATISESNTASLTSCTRGCSATTVEKLPNGYLLLRCEPHR